MTIAEMFQIAVWRLIIDLTAVMHVMWKPCCRMTVCHLACKALIVSYCLLLSCNRSHCCVTLMHRQHRDWKWAKVWMWARDRTQRNPNSMCDVLIWLVVLLSWTRCSTSGLSVCLSFDIKLWLVSALSLKPYSWKIIQTSACWRDSAFCRFYVA